MKNFFVPAFLLFSILGQAQKVSNKLAFQKGQKLEVVTTVKTNSEMMGQTMEMNIVAMRSLDIEDVNNGNAVIESKVKRMQFNFDGMGKSESFDSEKESDRSSDMGKNFEKALKNKFTMTVDPSGKITAVKADDDNPNQSAASDENGDMMSGMMAGLMTGFSLPKVGELTEFSILPAREIGRGETWTDTVSTNPDEKRKASFTVSDINDREIVIDYTEEIITKMTQENMGMEVTINKTDKNSGKIHLDRKTGLLKQRNVNTETTGTASVMGQEIPLDAKSTKTIVVTAK